ncbi:MAG: c-type cytochrome [bacterium]
MLFRLLLTSALLVSQSTLTHAAPTMTGGQIKQGIEVYQQYCARCHGAKADGHGRFERLYRKLDRPLPTSFLTGYLAERPDSYLKDIMLKGGTIHQRSEFMPPFEDEITEKDIDLLVDLIKKTARDGRLPTLSPQG